MNLLVLHNLLTGALALALMASAAHTPFSGWFALLAIMNFAGAICGWTDPPTPTVTLRDCTLVHPASNGRGRIVVQPCGSVIPR